MKLSWNVAARITLRRVLPSAFQSPYPLWFLILVAIFLGFNGLLLHPQTANNSREPGTYLALFDTLSVPEDAARNQIKFLTDILDQGIASTSQYTLSQENQKTQSRIFLFTILAALFSATVLMGATKLRYPNVIPYSATVLMIAMYMLEVHMSYLTERQKITPIHLQNTLDTLTSLTRHPNRWYTLDFYRFQLKAEDQWPRIKKKLCIAGRPNIQQVLCYFVPLVLVLALSIYQHHERRLTSGSS